MVNILNQYHIHLRGKAASGSAAWMGTYFFLYVVYYFFLGHVFEYTGINLFLQVIFPLILSGLFLVLYKGIRLDMHIVYTVLLTVLVLRDLNFGEDSLGSVLAILWLVAVVALYVLLLTKVLQTRVYLSLAAWLILIYQGYFLYSVLLPFSLDVLWAHLLQIAKFCLYLSFALYASSLIPAKRNK